MSPEKNKNVAYFGNCNDPEGIKFGWISWYLTQKGHHVVVCADSLSAAQDRITHADLEGKGVQVVIVDESLARRSKSEEKIGNLVKKIRDEVPRVSVIRYAGIDPQSGDTFVQKISTGNPVTAAPSLRTLAATISKL